VDTWTTFATTKAGIKFLRGNDLVAAQQNHPLARAMFTMRWSTKLKLMTEEMRINFDNRIWHIVFIDNVNYRNRELRVTVETGVIDHAN